MSKEFGFDSSAEEVASDVDLRGETIVVTGGSAGLGVETTRVLASRGAKIVSIVRNRTKGEEAARRIRESVPDAEIELAELDLSDLDSIRRGGDEIAGRFPKIDRLINNAGVMACPLGRTAQGLDLQLGTNHLGHFVLTARLMGSLLAGGPQRIVNLSSGGHQISPFRFDDPFFEKEPYDKWLAYGQAKTANILFSVGLDKRFGDRGLHAFAVHPGAIVTELGRHLQSDDVEQLMSRRGGRKLKYKQLSQGAATSVWAATATELEGRGGLYCEDCHVAQTMEEPGAGHGVMSYALDQAAADRLWSLSEQWSGEIFPG